MYLSTGISLVIATSIDLDDGKGRANSISPEFLEESLIQMTKVVSRRRQ